MHTFVGGTSFLKNLLHLLLAPQPPDEVHLDVLVERHDEIPNAFFRLSDRSGNLRDQRGPIFQRFGSLELIAELRKLDSPANPLRPKERRLFSHVIKENGAVDDVENGLPLDARAKQQPDRVRVG